MSELRGRSVRVLLFFGPRHRQFIDVREPLRDSYLTVLPEPNKYRLLEIEETTPAEVVSYKLEHCILAIQDSTRCGVNLYKYPVYMTSFESLEDISAQRIKLKALQRSDPDAFLDLVAFDLLFRGDKPVATRFQSNFLVELHSE